MLLIVGVNGQIGRALNALADDAVVLGREQADLSRPDTLRNTLEQFSPSTVINAAAYTQVDKAEEEEPLATTVNAEAPGVIAQFCKDSGIPFVHYSTDYVYDGSGDKPRSEDTPTAPLGAYGRSKLAGDKAVQAIGGDYLIFRTSWVYDAYGKNFVTTMLRLGHEREELKIVNDQFGAPSYAPHLAAATLQALGKARKIENFPSGIYHLCNSGVTSWHGFAEAIFAEVCSAESSSRRMPGSAPLKVKEITGIPTADYPTPAVRPHNSRLDLSKLSTTFGITMPDWQEGLTECLQAINEH